MAAINYLHKMYQPIVIYTTNEIPNKKVAYHKQKFVSIFGVSIVY